MLAFDAICGGAGFSLTSFALDAVLDKSHGFLTGGADNGFGGSSFLTCSDRSAPVLTVELEEEVDDSRTGGRPS